LLKKMTKEQRSKRVDTALQLVGLQDRANHYPSELSGGQEQRVAIARGIVGDAPLLLCDEPTGDLDRKTADSILDLLTDLNNEMQKTVIMVTHDNAATRFAHKVFQVNNGVLSPQD